MTTKRTMIVLPERTHKQLKHLAVERDTSLTQIIREAVESFLEEDLQDLSRARKVLASFSPGHGMSYDVYRKQRLKKKR